jgi:hypothetical protein
VYLLGLDARVRRFWVIHNRDVFWMLFGKAVQAGTRRFFFSGGAGDCYFPV